MLNGLIQPPTSTINIFVKDTSIVVAQARILNCAVPLAALVQQQFRMGQANGWGSDDDSR
jgi:3-hydroxyisobutyrate dehydrogenase-like beta-hydroxyacid dehydrogenase